MLDRYVAEHILVSFGDRPIIFCGLFERQRSTLFSRTPRADLTNTNGRNAITHRSIAENSAPIGWVPRFTFVTGHGFLALRDAVPCSILPCAIHTCLVTACRSLANP